MPRTSLPARRPTLARRTALLLAPALLGSALTALAPPAVADPVTPTGSVDAWEPRAATVPDARVAERQARALRRAARARKGPGVGKRRDRLGAWKVEGQRAYRLAPGRPVAKRYEAATVLPSTADRAWAAALIGKYGSLGGKRQAAAVDAALMHILMGRKWSLDRRKGKGIARVKRLGRQRGAVRYMARTMLERSRPLAGPYVASLTVAPVPGGGRNLVTRVTGTSGVPISSLIVTFTQNGGATGTSLTDSNGYASAPITSPAATTAAVTAVNVPNWDFTVRMPKVKGKGKQRKRNQRRYSPLLLASSYRTLGATTDVHALATGVNFYPVASTTGILVPLTGVLTVNGIPGTTQPQVDVAVQGPFPNPTAACTLPTGPTRVTVPNGGPVPSPNLVGRSAGWHRWAGRVVGRTTVQCGPWVRVG